MEELINAMSDEDLAGLKAKYSDNPSVVTLIDGILATRAKTAEQAVAMASFTKGIAKTFAKLPHPDNIHNVYARWAEVEVEDTTQEPEMVDITTKQAVTDKDGNVLEPAVIEPQPRYPTHKEWGWVVEVNHAIRAVSTSDTPKASKRAITVYKRHGTTLEPQGNFVSASKACEALKLIVGGDSATRVLARDGFITEPYDGTEFKS